MCAKLTLKDFTAFLRRFFAERRIFSPERESEADRRAAACYADRTRALYDFVYQHMSKRAGLAPLFRPAMFT